MTIHHNTIKRAAANGVTVQEKGMDKFMALWPEANVRITVKGDPKAAVDGIIAIKATMREYQGLKVVQDDNGTYSVLWNDKPIAEGENLREVLSEAVDIYGADETPAKGRKRVSNGRSTKDVDQEPDEDEDDEEGQEEAEEEAEEDTDEQPGSIVKEKYRAEYAARGNPDNCGDWFALTVEGFVQSMTEPTTKTITGKNGKPKTVKVKSHLTGDVSKHYALARANGVTKTWGHLSNGQQCMNARNMIRAIVHKNGELAVPASLTDGNGPMTIKADADWLEARKAKGGRGE